MSETLDSVFEPVRQRLFGLAYRMLGTRVDAEDLVQDVYLRWHQANRDSVRNAEAWLVTTATRLAIDRLRALERRREEYVGPWLPEPIMSDAPPPDHDLELASDLSMAFLILLERLGPEERAAFLLHDVFDVDYPEIATTLDKSENACRQIVHRARTRVRSARKRFAATESAKADLLRRFRSAVATGDEQALLALFAPDATWTTDGGGKIAAATRPIVGAERIAKLVLSIRHRMQSETASMELIEVNGETGLSVRAEGVLAGVMALETDGERIHAAYWVLNPDKLSQRKRPVIDATVPPSMLTNGGDHELTNQHP